MQQEVLRPLFRFLQQSPGVRLLLLLDNSFLDLGNVSVFRSLACSVGVFWSSERNVGVFRSSEVCFSSASDSFSSGKDFLSFKVLSFSLEKEFGIKRGGLLAG